MAALQEAAQAFQTLKDEIQKGVPGRGEIPVRAAQINQRLKERQDVASRQLSGQFRVLEAELTQARNPHEGRPHLTKVGRFLLGEHIIPILEP